MEECVGGGAAGDGEDEGGGVVETESEVGGGVGEECVLRRRLVTGAG